MVELQEDRKNLDELYAFGIRWLDQIENSLKEKDGELEVLRRKAAVLKEAREKFESLATVMRRPDNG